MGEGEEAITCSHLAWDIIVFTAVVVSLVSVSAKVLLDLNEVEHRILLLVDVAALAVFAVDLWYLWRHYTGPLRSFLYMNWLDVLSAIPVFRIIRIARFARMLKMARLRRLGKLRRIKEVKEKVKTGD